MRMTIPMNCRNGRLLGRQLRLFLSRGLTCRLSSLSRTILLADNGDSVTNGFVGNLHNPGESFVHFNNHKDGGQNGKRAKQKRGQHGKVWWGKKSEPNE